MNSRAIGGVLLLVAAWLSWGGVPSLPIPNPAPVPSHLEDLAEIGQPDARVWAGMLSGFAAFIAADGDTSSPVVRTMSDFDRMRTAAVAAPVRPIRGGQVVGRVLGAELAKLGTSNEPLDTVRRAALVKLLRDAASVLEGS